MESPNVGPNKLKKPRKGNTKGKDGKFQAQKKGLIYSDSYSESGNMYRVGFNNKTHISILLLLNF